MNKARGFTLTELAIALAIVGLVLAVVWVAGSRVLQAQQVSKASQELITIAQNIRAASAEQGGLVGAGGGVSLTTALDQLNVFPAEMRFNFPGASHVYGELVDPWSAKIDTLTNLGTVVVYADDCTGAQIVSTTPQPCFQIDFDDIPKAACINFLTLASPGDTGLQRVAVNSVNSLAGAANSQPRPLPVLADVASTLCNNANPDGSKTNIIFWTYQIRKS